MKIESIQSFVHEDRIEESELQKFLNSPGIPVIPMLRIPYEAYPERGRAFFTKLCLLAGAILRLPPVLPPRIPGVLQSFKGLTGVNENKS